MSGDISPYLGLLTSEYRSKPKLAASLATAVQPIADTFAQQLALRTLFDLDAGVGDQLDKVGQYVGATRFLTEAVPGVFFSFDVEGLGFDEGVWETGGTGTVIELDDDHYRLLLKARVLNNHWDGTIEHAYAIWDTLFDGTGLIVFIIDHGDLTMTMGLLTPADEIDALLVAMFTGGFLSVKPAGVRIRDYIVASARPPIFSLDEEGTSFAGLDEGSWAESLVGP